MPRLKAPTYTSPQAPLFNMFSPPLPATGWRRPNARSGAGSAQMTMVARMLRERASWIPTTMSTRVGEVRRAPSACLPQRTSPAIGGRIQTCLAPLSTLCLWVRTTTPFRLPAVLACSEAMAQTPRSSRAPFVRGPALRVSTVAQRRRWSQLFAPRATTARRPLRAHCRVMTARTPTRLAARPPSSALLPIPASTRQRAAPSRHHVDVAR